MTARLPASFLTGKKPRFPVSPKADRTLDGHVFDSKLECRRYAELRQKEKAGIIRELSLQPEFNIQINGYHFCTYSADFRYRDVDSGEIIFEDVKGRGKGGTAGDAAFRLRKKAAELFYGIKIMVVSK